MTGAVVGSTCRGSELGTLHNQEKQVQVEQGKRPSHTRPCVVQLSRVYSKSRGSYGRREQGAGTASFPYQSTHSLSLPLTRPTAVLTAYHSSSGLRTC